MSATKGGNKMSRRPKRTCEEIQFEKGCHAPDLRKMALEGIKNYFADKSWFIGGPIPECELLTDLSIDTVLKTPFNGDTFDFIHNECLKKVPQPKSFVDQGVPWTVSFLIKMLSDMKKLGLPKDFQPGFALLYFKFCKGVKIPLPAIL